MKELSKPLTWDDLANEYDKSHHGRCARTLPMDSVFKWAEDQKDKFKVTKDGMIHRIINK